MIFDGRARPVGVKSIRHIPNCPYTYTGFRHFSPAFFLFTEAWGNASFLRTLVHFLCVLDSRMSSKGSFIPWAARYGRSAAQRTAPGFFRAGFYNAAPSGSLTRTERWLYDNYRGTFVFDAATLEQTNTYFLYQSVYRRVRIMNRIIIELLISTFLFLLFYLL